MSVQIANNALDVVRLVEKYREVAIGWWFSKEERQRFANDIAEAGKFLLVETTANNIARSPRWKLSGMASKFMGGGTNNPIDTAWKPGKVTPDSVSWSNANPIYRFLDQGTRAHGPVKAKKLFIPLNEETALAYLNGSLSRGSDGGIETVYAEHSEQIYAAGQKKAGQSRRKKLKGGATRKLVWGVDFILKDWVKGIEPRRITEQFLTKMQDVLAEIHRNRIERAKQNAAQVQQQKGGNK